jgi:hypothetical protein
MWVHFIHRTISRDHFLPKLKKPVSRSGQRRMRISNVPTVKSLLPIFQRPFFRATVKRSGRSDCRGHHCHSPRIDITLTVRQFPGDISGMKSSLRIHLLMSVATFLLVTNSGEAGDLFHHGRRATCDCNGSSAQVAYNAPVLAYAQPIRVAPAIENACACTSAATGCCGLGGGMMQLGSFYGAGSIYGAGDAHYGSPAVGSFLSGYEGLPNMDGGGIHHRYPYHSYRRPWAHPGTPSTNITIVW